MFRRLARRLLRLNVQLVEHDLTYWLSTDGQRESAEMQSRLDVIRAALVIALTSFDLTPGQESIARSGSANARALDSILADIRAGRSPERKAMRSLERTCRRLAAAYDASE